MAASIPFSAPHRKLATYGKPSRKRIEGFRIENQRPRSTSSSASYGTESQSIIRHQDAEIRAAVLRAGNELAPRQADNRQGTGPRIVPSNTAIAARDPNPGSAQRTARMEGVVITSRPNKLKETSGLVFAKGSDELRVFDFLSSDEETESKGAVIARPHLSHDAAAAAAAQRSAYSRFSPTRLTRIIGGKRTQVVPDESGPTSSKRRKLSTHNQDNQQSGLFNGHTAQQRTSVFLRYRASQHDSDDTDESLDTQITRTPATPMTSKMMRATAKSPLTQSAADMTPKAIRNRAGPTSSSNKLIQTQQAADSPSNRTVWQKRQTSSGKVLPKEPRPAQQLPRCETPVADMRGKQLAATLSASPKLKRAQSAIEIPKTPPRGASPGGNDEATPKARPALHATSPRHTELWGQLLQGEVEDYDPSVLPMNQLGLSLPTSSKGSTEGLEFTQSASQLAAANSSCRPRKLIDSLKVGASSDTNVDTNGVSEAEPSDNIPVEFATLSSDSQSTLGHGVEEQESMKSSEDMSANSQTCSQSNPSQTILGMQPGGAKVTYARQRSYLSEASLDEELLSQTPPDSQVSSYSQGRRRAGMGAPISLGRLSSFAEEEEDPGPGNIKSIHELREAGVTKRFMNEFEGMLEDIIDRSASTMSTRRTNLLELARKLSHKSNARRFLDLALDRRLFSQLDAEDDIISSCVFASIVLQLSREGMEAHSLLHICQEGVFDMLTGSLRVNQDITLIAKDRRNGLSKASQALISDFRTLVRQLLSWTEKPEQVTPRAIALVTLESLLRSLREAGDTYYTLSPDTIDVILSVIDRPSGWASSQPLCTQEMQEVEVAISIFDASTMISGLKFGTSAQEAAWALNIKKWLLFVTGSSTDELKQIQMSVLRLVLNVTNNSSSLCDSLASPAVIRALAHTVRSEFSRQTETLGKDEEDVYSVDYLILTLATMTNLLESNNNIRDNVLVEQTDGISVLDALLQPFLRGLERTAEADSMEETHFNVAFGYLSVLLSNLCLRDDMRPQIGSRMPGQTIQPILGAALEFLQYHQQVDSQMSDTNHNGSSRDGFTEKLQEMIKRLMEA